MPTRPSLPTHSRRIVIAIAAAATVALAVATTPGSAAVQTPSCPQPLSSSFTVSLTIGTLTRTAQVHVPPNAPAGVALPLVLAFHGSRGNGRMMAAATALSALADAENFIVVYPNAADPYRFWEVFDGNGAPDDVGFTSDLLDQLEATLCVDSTRIYATGVSNGGGFAARVGCELSDRIAAIAPVAGGYRSLPKCAPVRPLSVLEVHGTTDRVVPYLGTPPDYAGSVPGYMSGWAARNRCSPTPGRRMVAPFARLKSWVSCADGVAVQHLELYGVGHEWPQTIGIGGLSTSRWIWHFFSGRRISAKR
jgi:polyhydroxybutyrate depolymerase